MVSSHDQERQPLLGTDSSQHGDDAGIKYVQFEEDDTGNPRNWTRRKKLLNTTTIALMAILSPLVSSVFTPAISNIAESLDTSKDSVVAAATGFVAMLGVGPLILAPLSETFGRRILYIGCFSLFTLLQIPTALAPNLETLVVLRTLAGFFGSVSIANGGGSLSDMWEPSQRAEVYSWYLLGPLLGPSAGPILGGLVVELTGSWRWMFAIIAIICGINTTVGYFLLSETYAPKILKQRCLEMEKNHGGHYSFEGEDSRRISTKILQSLKRPILILFTPVVLPIAIYHALLFAVMYTMYTNMEEIFGSEPYSLSTLQTSSCYLLIGLGFVISIRTLVPRIDTIFNHLSEKHGAQKPEFRLPLANLGAVLMPIWLIYFGWAVQAQFHLAAVLVALPFIGIAQVLLINTVTNYYIDAFPEFAASAIAAGSLFRSLVGGAIPLIGPEIFRRFGYGWGWTIFGGFALALAPMPLVFMRFGEKLRNMYKVQL